MYRVLIIKFCKKEVSVSLRNVSCVCVRVWCVCVCVVCVCVCGVCVCVWCVCVVCCVCGVCVCVCVFGVCVCVVCVWCVCVCVWCVYVCVVCCPTPNQTHSHMLWALRVSKWRRHVFHFTAILWDVTFMLLCHLQVSIFTLVARIWQLVVSATSYPLSSARVTSHHPGRSRRLQNPTVWISCIQKLCEFAICKSQK